MTPKGPKLAGSAEQTDLKTKEQTRIPEPPEQKVGGSNPLGRTNFPISNWHISTNSAVLGQRVGSSKSAEEITLLKP
jgi:hypothetical protein